MSSLLRVINKIEVLDILRIPILIQYSFAGSTNNSFYIY
jgi:hypothetical protein